MLILIPHTTPLILLLLALASLLKMSPTATGPAPSGVAPISKKAQVTPDDKTTNDPRDSNIHRAIAQHPYGGAANLRDVFTNQGEL